MYGSNIKTENVLIPEVGIQKEVRLTEVKFEENRLSFVFEQSTGARVIHSEFKANPDWNIEEQQTNTSRRVKHIAEASGIALNIEKTESFEEYVTQIIEAFGVLSDCTFNMIFIYNKKGFVCLPKYPPFIEKTREDNTSKLKVSEYNKQKMIRIEPDPEPLDTTETATEKDNLPF